jgi:Effector-associated domain 11
MKSDLVLKIEVCIANAKLEEAFALLKPHLDSFTQLGKALILLKKDWRALENKQATNNLYLSEYNVESAKITTRLLNLLEDIDNKEQSSSTSSKVQKTIYFLLPVALVILIIVYYVPAYSEKATAVQQFFEPQETILHNIKINEPKNRTPSRLKRKKPVLTSLDTSSKQLSIHKDTLSEIADPPNPKLVQYDKLKRITVNLPQELQNSDSLKVCLDKKDLKLVDYDTLLRANAFKRDFLQVSLFTGVGIHQIEVCETSIRRCWCVEVNTTKEDSFNGLKQCN